MAKKILDQVTAVFAYQAAKQSANSTCDFWYYQPKLPDAVKKLKKHHA